MITKSRMHRWVTADAMRSMVVQPYFDKEAGKVRVVAQAVENEEVIFEAKDDNFYGAIVQLEELAAGHIG